MLLISGYLYYEYINNNNTSDINIENTLDEDNQNKSSVVEKAILKEKKDEDIIIVHIEGAVCNPRNCKD